ncbi:MAG: hypoxanthine phosphoribosyltransferase [Phycisphaerae bacterium]|nr:hypoxanthine phosphoribosyltransferase [Phycisphaerae bacterium]
MKTPRPQSVQHPSRESADRATDGELVDTLVSREQITQRLAQLSDELTAHYQAAEVTLLVVLTGALVFVADLIRRLELPLRIAVAQVSSYPGRSTRSQGPTVTLPGPADLTGRRVLVADDILDSGATLAAIRQRIDKADPAEVRTCVLLRKRRADGPPLVQADHVGFDIPDVFVVGYGLDHNNLYRNLPDIHALRLGEGEEMP